MYCVFSLCSGISIKVCFDFYLESDFIRILVETHTEYPRNLKSVNNLNSLLFSKQDFNPAYAIAHLNILVCKCCGYFSLISILQILFSLLSVEPLFSTVHMHSHVCMNFKDTVLETSHIDILFYLKG